MDQIRPWLYIGNLQDSKNFSYLKQNSIEAILQLEAPVEHEGITSLYLRIQDKTPVHFTKFQQGLGFIKDQKSLGRQVLVACHYGVSRSSTFCIAALKMEEGLSLFDSFKEVNKSRSEAMPDLTIWESLCSFYDEKASHIELSRLMSSKG